MIFQPLLAKVTPNSFNSTLRPLPSLFLCVKYLLLILEGFYENLQGF
jgi:hypothetical protein